MASERCDALRNNMGMGEPEMTKQATLVIYASSNGRDGWKPVLPGDVPAWVKEPRIIGALIAGEMCMDPKASSGSTWFRGERAA